MGTIEATGTPLLYRLDSLADAVALHGAPLKEDCQSRAVGSSALQDPGELSPELSQSQAQIAFEASQRNTGRLDSLLIGLPLEIHSLNSSALLFRQVTDSRAHR